MNLTKNSKLELSLTIREKTSPPMVLMQFILTKKFLNFKCKLMKSRNKILL